MMTANRRESSRVTDVEEGVIDLGKIDGLLYFLFGALKLLLTLGIDNFACGRLWGLRQIVARL